MGLYIPTSNPEALVDEDIGTQISQLKLLMPELLIRKIKALAALEGRTLSSIAIELFTKWAGEENPRGAGFVPPGAVGENPHGSPDAANHRFGSRD